MVLLLAEVNDRNCLVEALLEAMLEAMLEAECPKLLPGLSSSHPVGQESQEGQTLLDGQHLNKHQQL